jgi:PAS domain S-box-containing protein
MAILANAFPLRTRLALTALAVAAPLVAAVAFVAFHASRDERERATVTAQVAADGAAARLSGRVGELATLLAALAAEPAIGSLDPAACERAIAGYARLHPELARLAVVDARGRTRCGPPAEALADGRVLAPAFAAALRGGPVIAGDAATLPGTRQWVQWFASPIAGPRDEAALLVVALDLARLAPAVASPAPDGPVVCVLDATGRVMARSRESARWVGHVASPAIRSAVEDGDGPFEGVDPDGLRRLYASAAVPGTRWHVIAGLDAQALESAESSRWLGAGGAGLAIVLVALGIAFATGRAIDGRRGEISPARSTARTGDIARPAGADETRFRTVVESAPDGIFIQAGGRFAWLNRRAAEIYGATDAAGLVGRPVVDFVHPDHREAVAERIRRLNEARQAAEPREETILRQDGSPIEVEVNAVPFDHEGTPGALVFLRDITARRRDEARLHRSEARFRGLLDASPSIAVQGYDRNRRAVFWNPASERLYGFTQGEAIGRPMEDLVVPDAMRADLVRDFARWIESGQPMPCGELTLRHRDGHPVHVFASHVALPSAAGDPEMFCVTLDLDALDRARSEANAWRSRLQAAIIASGQLLHEWNPATGEMTVFGDTGRVLGYPTAELEGGIARWRELVHREDLAAFDSDLAASIRGNLPFRGRYRVRRADGRWLDMQHEGFFVVDDAGGIERMVCFMRDVTDDVRNRGEIERQLDELRRWHEALLGRESRILELKAEVNDLLASAGLPPRYESARDEATPA